MKALRILFGITFIAGMLLIIGAVGTDDFYTMELQQVHQMNWLQIIIGFLMTLPLLYSLNARKVNRWLQKNLLKNR